MKPHAWMAAVVVAACATACRGGEPSIVCPDLCACPSVGCADDTSYLWSFEFRAGYYEMRGWGPTAIWEGVNYRADYAPVAVRLGCECPHVFFPGTWTQGTFEGLLEYSAAPITRNFGNYFTGPCAILRFNYKQDDCCLVPYLQAGAGLAFTDAHQEQRQYLIGQSPEFLLRAEVGVKWFLTENFSLDVEGGFQHISNACLSDRNGGINNLGGTVGFTYRFGK